MFISVVDIFKIGVGPSSSHTMGPMTAAAAFLKAVQDGGAAFDPATLTALEAQLCGSLAFTGKGHATDRAVILGLMGFEPASLDAEFAEARLTEMRATGRLAPPGLPEVAFDPERHVIFDYGPPLAMHANGMKLRAQQRRGPARGDLLLDRRRLHRYRVRTAGLAVAEIRPARRPAAIARLSLPVRQRGGDAPDGERIRQNGRRDEAGQRGDCAKPRGREAGARRPARHDAELHRPRAQD